MKLLLLSCVILVIPYILNFWWKFLPSLALIVFLSSKMSPNPVSTLGFKIRKTNAAVAVATFILTFASAYILVDFLCEKNGIRITDEYGNWHIGWKLSPIFQSLGEEIVFRAFLLGTLTAYWTSRHRIVFSAAMLFTVWHVIFFPMAQGVWLSGLTLVTLFLFAIATNYLYLAYQNIAVPWALHAGWNLVKFSNDYYQGENRLNEAEMFNIVEGYWLTTLSAAALALVGLVVFRKNILPLGQ